MSPPSDRLLWIGLEGPDPEQAAARVRELRAGGVVLFRRNIESARQMHDLITAVKEVAGPAGLPVALDQEGGRVDRLRDLLGPSPSARRLSREGVGAARTFGSLTGEALRLLGVDVDFAPVLDLDCGQEEGAIGDRAWGTEAAKVIDLAGGFLSGLEEKGIRSCLKHWPGLGRAACDPHHDLPRIEAGDRELAEDQAPFFALSSPGRFVMTAHCIYPALGAEEVPATCCRTALEPLRARGFPGALIADDLEMGALGGDTGTAAVKAAEAGCDVLLLCGRDAGPAAEAREALRRAPGLEERVRDAAGRTEQTLGELRGQEEFEAGKWARLVDAYRRFCEPLLERGAGGSDPTERP